MKSPYFVQPVLDSLKIDGKLTSIPSSFCIKTVVGKSEDVGKKSGWTIEELDRALEQKGKSCSAFPGWLTSNELMLWICDISLGQFIDWNLLKSDFNNDDFISLLKFCKDTPKEFDASTYSGDYADNILLTVQFIQNHNYLETMRKNYGSGDITYIGFPNNNGNNGSFFACTQNDIQLAIPAFSEKQSSAWQFIKLMLTDKIQASVNNFPIVNAQLKSRLYSLSNRKDSSMDKTEIEKFYSLIEDTVLFTHSDSIIRDIVISEVGAFFNGEKTAEDVAMQIISRVNIYLSETK